MSMRIVGLVPAFNPGPSLLTLVSAVADQVDTVVVVDDGSASGLDVLDRVAKDHLVLHQDNRGIGSALNTGLEAIRELGGVEAVLTLDQDSTLPPGYVLAAANALTKAIAASLPVAFVTAASYAGHPTPTDGAVGEFDVARDPMQSGSLVPMTTFARCGDFVEDYVIDAVDSEFTARCRALGLRPLIAPEAALDHLMGTRVPATVFGRGVRRGGQPMAINAHSSVRVYYMARNSLLLARAHGRNDLKWTLRRLAEEGMAHALRLGFGPHKRADARAIMAGVRDAVRNRTGVAPASVQSPASNRR